MLSIGCSPRPHRTSRESASLWCFFLHAFGKPSKWPKPLSREVPWLCRSPYWRHANPGEKLVWSLHTRAYIFDMFRKPCPAGAGRRWKPAGETAFATCECAVTLRHGKVSRPEFIAHSAVPGPRGSRAWHAPDHYRAASKCSSSDVMLCELIDTLFDQCHYGRPGRCSWLRLHTNVEKGKENRLCRTGGRTQ